MRKYNFVGKQNIVNNRGASLVIIVAIFALFMVLSLNVIMAAYSTTTGLDEEYESECINMYVSSVHNCISEKIENGTIPQSSIFVAGQVKTLKLTGFDGGDGSIDSEDDVTVIVEKSSGTKDATAIFQIPYKGKTYTVQTVYTITADTVILKSSSGILQSN